MSGTSGSYFFARCDRAGEERFLDMRDSGLEARGHNMGPKERLMAERSLLLRFSVDGEEIRVVGRENINRHAPLSDPLDMLHRLPLSQGVSGYWIELQDSRGQPLFIEKSSTIRSEPPLRPQQKGA